MAKLKAKEYMRIEGYSPVYYLEIYRKGVKVATVRSEELLTFSGWKDKTRHDNRIEPRMGSRLAIVDNYGCYYTLRDWCAFENIAENYHAYKMLKAQLEREHPEVVMESKEGIKRYSYNFRIVRVV